MRASMSTAGHLSWADRLQSQWTAGLTALFMVALTDSSGIGGQCQSGGVFHGALR